MLSSAKTIVMLCLSRWKPVQLILPDYGGVGGGGGGGGGDKLGARWTSSIIHWLCIPKQINLTARYLLKIGCKKYKNDPFRQIELLTMWNNELPLKRVTASLL